MAHNGEEHEAATTTSVREEVKGRLDEAKKKVCENRATAIKRLMNQAAEQGTKKLNTFGTYTTRIQEFYSNNTLVVANYDALVAAVAAKKVAAQTAIATVKDNTSFDCNAENPVNKINAFNGQVKTMVEALKEYRASIKNLLIAVKQAADAAQKGDQ